MLERSNGGRHVAVIGRHVAALLPVRLCRPKAVSPLPGALMRLGLAKTARRPDATTARTFLPDGKSILTRCDQKILRWDAATGKLLEKVEPPVQTSSFLTTNDGKWIVATSPNAILQVFDAAAQLHHSIQTMPWLHLWHRFRLENAGCSEPGQRSLTLYDLTTGEKHDLPLPTAPNREQYAGASRALISTRHARYIGAGTEGHRGLGHRPGPAGAQHSVCRRSRPAPCGAVG